MTGLDNPNNYKLLSPEGKETALTLSSAGADTVTLAASGFTRDGWKLALSGLTDASMAMTVFRNTDAARLPEEDIIIG